MTAPRRIPDPRQPAALAAGALAGVASTVIAVALAGWLAWRGFTRALEDEK